MYKVENRGNCSHFCIKNFNCKNFILWLKMILVITLNLNHYVDAKSSLIDLKQGLTNNQLWQILPRIKNVLKVIHFFLLILQVNKPRSCLQKKN